MIGDVVEKKRNEVDNDRNSTCSRGLHFCSIEYLPHYEGGHGKVMIIKINPKNVVSIPVDYNNAKGRCCKYEVVGEYIGSNKEKKDYTEAPIVATNGQEKNFHNKRDSKGRFIKKDAVVVSDTVKFHNVRDSKGRFIKKDHIQVGFDGNTVVKLQNGQSKTINQINNGDVLLGNNKVVSGGNGCHNKRDSKGRFVK
jgi:hypothetical protein